MPKWTKATLRRIGTRGSAARELAELSNEADDLNRRLRTLALRAGEIEHQAAYNGSSRTLNTFTPEELAAELKLRGGKDTLDIWPA